MKKTIHISLFLAFVVAMISACGEDRTHEYYEKTEENQWTYSKMKDVYLWRDKIKEPSRTTFFSTPSKFFSTILNNSDKASYFTDTLSSGSYGMTFALMRDPIGVRPSKVYALVLMVEPGSPADIAGVERGTWISSVRGSALTTSKTSLLQSGGSTRLVTEYIEHDDDTQKDIWISGDTLQLGAATDYNEQAIQLDTIYSERSKRIGYLLVNNFNGEGFINDAQSALLRFAENNVSDVVIDLRYNSGGSIANAVSLASSFVAPELYGSTFCNLVNAYGETDTTYCYSAQQTSLYEKRLHIITGTRTTGTAELFTAALNTSRPMYDLMTFGAKSAGSSLVTKSFESPYGFIINPATNYMALENGDILTAISPDFQLDELKLIENIHTLGSGQEYILYNIVYYITNGSMPE